MSPAALGLVLASALLHAAWNAALKRERDTAGATVAVLAVAAALALAWASLQRAPAFPRPAGAGWAIVAGLCEGGYFATLAAALARAPLGLAYTVARGGAIVAVWPASVLLLGETVTGTAAAGAALLCAGMAAAGVEGVSARAGAGVAWAALCALFIAGYHLAYKQSLSAGAAPGALFALSLAVALPVNLALLGRRGPARVWSLLRARPAPLAGAGLTLTAAFLLFLVALAEAGAGAVLTLRNTSVLFAQALGWAMGERPTARGVAGGVLVALGATLLGWPR